MMKPAPWLAAAILAVAVAGAPAPLGAQVSQNPDSRCTTQGHGGDACQKALDMFNFLNPQVATLIAGGNATLGQGGALGGLGRFAITLRVNGTEQLAVPDLDLVEIEAGEPRRAQFVTSSSPGGFPVADVAAGLYAGYPVGPTRIGGVDALVNIFYLPESINDLFDEGEGLSLTGTETGFTLSYGVRIGLVEESARWPGVSLTYLRRNLPAITVSLTDADDFDQGSAVRDTVTLRDFRVQTNAWRLVAGKRVLRILDLAAGIGRDSYQTDGRLAFAVTADDGIRVTGGFPFDQQVTRTNMFADLSVNLYIFRLVGEIGRVSGGNVQTFNEFDVDPNAPRTYGAVGIRFGR